ncbi:hypothetical protein ANCDUO_01438 [Ancylostoma duodenale]|uniref:SWIM-type domain-containing protein n=1 Tax=Ancylostoma duodenale TaxID=51022 RepID=A0A0C2HF72_9BILA|nr:hypothetical protein ANCDUO_01438 [Ancylostoma duodenale]
MQLDWLRKFSARGIAVDDTHNVTRYNVRLATVSVADHKNRGLPAGRTASWASFGNSGAIMDTTMISERWHLRSKKDFLHRNSNSRADFLVEKYFLDRRLTTAPYRVQQSTRSHRWAVKHFQWKPEKIKATGDRKWEQCRTPEEKFQVSYQGGCVCSVSLSENVHCPFCDVCAYSWTCTCLENRTGISCLHRYAAKHYGWDLAVQPQLDHRCLPGCGRALNICSTSHVSSGTQVGASEMRNSIESKYSVVYTNVNLLVNTDTDEALTPLKQIYDLVDQASRIKLSTPSEPTPNRSKARALQAWGKPQLTKAEHYTVS